MQRVRRHLLLPAVMLLTAVPLAPSRAQTSCSLIYPAHRGWAIDLCASDPAIEDPMTVYLNGVERGEAALIRIYHRTDSGGSMPQVAVLYSSGFVRLKQNADPPGAPIPFGTSAILGVAYWADSETYFHNPQLESLRIKTADMPESLDLVATGSSGDFHMRFRLSLPAPTDQRTKLHVVQTATATSAVEIDQERAAQAEGFKLFQASSMYVNEGGTCSGGFVDCHDSDATRFFGVDSQEHVVAFRDLTPPSLVFGETMPLGRLLLDVLHSDDASWQGNTPSIRFRLDALPFDHTVTPQGFITATDDPNQDNVGVWLQDDLRAEQGWAAGERERVTYWVISKDYFN